PQAPPPRERLQPRRALPQQPQAAVRKLADRPPAPPGGTARVPRTRAVLDADLAPGDGLTGQVVERLARASVGIAVEISSTLEGVNRCGAVTQHLRVEEPQLVPGVRVQRLELDCAHVEVMCPAQPATSFLGR